jgi:type II secretory pathway component PulJ
MLAVVFLMSIVLFVAIDFYLDLSRESTAAAEETRNARRAVVLLDRVARDLEGAVLLTKPPEVDPLAWHWLFLADSPDSSAGADRVKFVRRGHESRSSDAPESDLEVVAWFTADAPDGSLELLRWSFPQLPDGNDRDFPTPDEGDLVASGLASFGIRFEDDTGQWTGRWDSSTLIGSSQLPQAAEIEVSFVTPDGQDTDGPYRRRVLLPMRPLDLAAQLAKAEGKQAPSGPLTDLNGDGVIDGKDAQIAAQNQQDQTGDNQQDDKKPPCVTVGACLAAHPEIQASLSLLGPEAQAVITGSVGQCASDFVSVYPSVPADCLQ